MSLPKNPNLTLAVATAKRAGEHAGRILKMARREGEGYVRAAMREEFISG